MDLQELLNALANQVAFWSKSGEQPGTLPIVNDTRDLFKETGKLVDDYVLGGTYQANMRGQDALLGQLALNAVAGGVGAGVGVGASRVVPKVATKLTPQFAALRQWIKPRDIGIHLSPFNEIDAVLPNINVNRGAGGIPNYPIVPGQTYKFSSKDYLNNNVSPNRLLDSAEKYVTNIPLRNNEGVRSLYVTKSKLGNVDPETQVLIDNIKNKVYSSWAVPSNGRIIPKQEILKSVQFTVPDYVEYAKRGLNNLPLDTPVLENGRKLPDALRDDLLKLIGKQQSIENVKSLLRATAVGGTAAGTALTPLVAARPALGFNNRK